MPAAHHAAQLTRLLFERRRRSGRLFDERGVLLRNFVHLHHSAVDLLDASRLLFRCRADLAHDVGHAAHGLDDLFHRRACPADQGRAALHLGNRVADQFLDFLGGTGAALREVAHFAGHHREAAALLTRPGRFHGGVQREDVGLEGNPFDHADDVHHLVRAGGDVLHRVNDLAHHVAAARRDVRRVDRKLARLAGILGVLPHGARQLFHARCSLLQRSGLLLGALREIGVAHGNFARTGVDRFGAAVHAFEHRREAVLHLLDAAKQASDFVGAGHRYRVRQVACGDPLETLGGVQERLHDQAAQRDPDHHDEHQREHAHRDDQRGHERDVRLGRRLLIGRALLQCLHNRRGGIVVGDKERADFRVGNRMKTGLVARVQRRELRLHAFVHHGRATRQQVVEQRLVDAGLGRIQKRLPALITLAKQFLPAAQHLFRFVGIAGGSERVVPVDCDARAQQITRCIVECMNSHQIAARNAVERLARTAERGEAERADYERQRHQNDSDHGQ